MHIMRLLLQRYLAANFIRPFMAATAFFVIFLLTFQLFRVTDLIVSKGLTFGFVLELVWQIALSLIPLALPLSIYFSTIYSLGKASEESELVVMRSVGMSKIQILTPYLLVALMASILLFFINDILAPRANIAFKAKMEYLKSQATLTDVKPGEFFTLIPNLTLFSQRFDQKTNRLEDVFIHFTGGDKSQKTIYARSGEIHKTSDGGGAQQMNLLLKDGNILQVKNNVNEKILFKEYLFPINLGGGVNYNPKPQNMEGKDLNHFLDLSFEEFSKLQHDPNHYYKVKVEYHNRRSMPFMVIIFTLLGFSLGFKSNRRKNRGSVLAFVYLAGYYVIYFLAMSVANSGNISIPLLMYTPAALLFLIFLYHYRKIDWAQ